MLISMLLVVYFSNPVDAGNNPKVKAENRNQIPDSLKTIFKNSCISCHSSGGNMIAESHLNFDKWNNYKIKKQIKKADKICDMITEGKMPPKKTREAKPETIPTKAQIDYICKWVNSLGKQ